MPLSPRTKWHHVDDCQIRKITADPEGGDATFGDYVDVPGIKTIGVGGEVNNTSLRGDNRLLDSYSTLSSISVSVNHARMSLEVLQILLGATLANSGTTPNQIADLKLNGDSKLNYFELTGRTTGVDTIGGDGLLILAKLVISGFPDVGFAEEDYRTVSFAAMAMPRLSDGEWFDIKLRETAAEIAA